MCGHSHVERGERDLHEGCATAHQRHRLVRSDRVRQDKTDRLCVDLQLHHRDALRSLVVAPVGQRVRGVHHVAVEEEKPAADEKHRPDGLSDGVEQADGEEEHCEESDEEEGVGGEEGVGEVQCQRPRREPRF